MLAAARSVRGEKLRDLDRGSYKTSALVYTISLESFSKLTETQRYVLGMCAISQDAGHHPRTLESLVKKGMLVARQENRDGHRVLRYDVPIGVHIIWCQWCSENVKKETD